jgi:alpha-D-ribose 1-methylphosphonate 5-triphosphate synthase subunit PhnG
MAAGVLGYREESVLVRTLDAGRGNEPLRPVETREYRAKPYAVVGVCFPRVMVDPHDRSDRFELIAACEAGTLARLANEVLEEDPPLSVRQEPRPQLLMQRVEEPVERRPFNLGEVLVTPAEVELAGERGFAMAPGKAERAALSGAIVDAAVAGGHERTPAIVDALEDTATRQREQRRQSWAESKHTAVEFETMEDQQ